MLPSAKTPTRLFLLLAPLLYVAYALFTPPFQTPDEQQHLFRAYQIASFKFVGVRHGQESGGDLPPSLVRAAAQALGTAAPYSAIRSLKKRSFLGSFTHGTALDLSETPHFTNFLGSVTYSPVGYVPQVLAVWIGRAMDLSVETIVRFGRVLNAAVTVALLYAAFRALPMGHLLLLAISLFPMTAACAGAFGQDGIIIGGSAWLTALCLRAVIQGHWSGRETIVAAALTTVLTVAKIVYLPLAALALLPCPKRTTIRRWMMPQIPYMLLAAIILAVWLHLVNGLFIAARPGIAAPGAQIAEILHHPLVFPQALLQTYLFDVLALAATLFKFGWLNVGPVISAAGLTLLAFLVVVWHGDERARLLPTGWRGWALLVCLSVVVLLALALYVAWSPLGAKSVSGLQGRYYIPIALPFLLAFLRHGSARSSVVIGAAATLLVAANIAVLVAIGKAYYL